MRKSMIVLIAALASCPPATPQARAAEARDFDLQGFVDRAVAAGETRIVVPPGRYRVRPRDRQHLVLRDLKDVAIVADGVEMVCTETTRAISIDRCRNVSLRGLTIDYDPLPFTQGRIAAISPDKKAHEIELFEGYPGGETALDFKYEIFRPDTRTLRCPDYPFKVEKVDARHIRVVKGRASRADPEQVGDLIVIGSETAPGGSIPHAVVCSEDVDVRLEDVALYASNCFGFLEYDCDGTTYLRCRVDRRPPGDDPVGRADARLRSLDADADAFHSKHAIRGPRLIGCVAKFMGDDGVNICGNYHMITARRGAELRVLAKDRMNVAVGDPVELLAYDGSRRPDARVVAIEPDGSIDDDERAFLVAQRMNEGLRTRWRPKAFKVTLDRDEDLPRGSLLASARRMGNGFLVQGCDFGFNRSRGILIKASGGRVVGNTLTENWGEAIKVAPEYWWLESGSSNDVAILDNVIRGCRATGIEVTAHGGQGKLAPAGAHNRIVVSGNRLADGPLPNISVSSTDDLRIEANTIVGPRPGRRAGLPAIEATNCTRATVQPAATPSSP